MLRQIHKRTSLTVKFITAISTVIICILSALAGNFIFTIKHTLGEQSEKVVRGLESELEHDQVRLKAALKEKGEKYGDLLQLIARGLFLNYDYETLGKIAKHIVSDNEIAAVVFYDGSGKPLNLEGTEQGKNSLEILRDISFEGEKYGSLRISLDTTLLEKRVAEVTEKIVAQKTVSIAEQAAVTEKVIRQLVVISLAGILVLGCVIFFVFKKIIISPLTANMRLAESISRGNLSERIQDHAYDEIGMLATALNTMADGLEEKATLATAIAEGDLTNSVQLGSDEDVLGKALNTMDDTLNDFFNRIRVMGDEIAKGSGQVSESSQSLSSGSVMQASSLEEISSSLNEITSQTKLSADNARQANILSNDSKGVAHDGTVKMSEMIDAMHEIHEAAQNISKIIKVIDEIAFQTNLLALNAAVEAARAGQHGKGFAVVAEEVRNLAARSAQAAKETAELIEGSVLKTDKGSRLARETEAALDNIVTAITKVSDLVAEIFSAFEEQAEGISQINEGLGQINQVTQENTASAEKSASAAVQLSSQSATLKTLLLRFRLKTHHKGEKNDPPAVLQLAEK